MLEMLEKSLRDKGVFSGAIPNVLANIMKAIPSQIVPEKMKATIAVTEMMLYASHFKRHIYLWNKSKIPINAISIVLAKSGLGKDSSVNAVRKCFSSGYEIINKKRKDNAKSRAIRLASDDGVENPNDFNTYKKYYREPNPLFLAPSTVEGFIQHLNDLEEEELGAGYTFTGEFGSELSTNSNIIENIRLLAELYDEGNKQVKMLKNRQQQSKEVNNLATSAMFIGSQDNILLDNNIKRVFKTEMITKLARRSFFHYQKETVEQPTYTSVEDMLKVEMALEDNALIAREQVNDLAANIANYNLSKVGQTLEVSDEVRELYYIYQKYNTHLAETIKLQYEVTRLVRMHMQWKALKLSGAIAMFEGSDIIQKKHFIDAITFVEMIDKDILDFEIELSREPYELFALFMHQIAEDNKSYANVHTLKKMGYIQGSSNLQNRLRELCSLASNFDESGVYTYSENGISFERIIRTNACGVSYLFVDGSKESRAKNCNTGYEYGEFSFEALGDMLKQNVAYSPFKFKDGVRGKDNIEGGCKWIALDVDKSIITDRECHTLLQAFTHHIARTSDPNNEFKFRILLELESEINIENAIWKDFIQSISKYLGISVDPLCKSQIFFSYANNEVLSNIAKPLEVKQHILYAKGQIDTKQEASKITKSELKAIVESPISTFIYAYEAPYGEGSVSLIRAAHHAKDLGMSKDQIIELMYSINDYWEQPMSNDRLENTIINQIRRF